MTNGRGRSQRRAIILGMDCLTLPILRRFAAEGVLPNFSRLMAEGTTNEAMPCLPCYTPSNWATLATGAWPGTHGAANWYDARPTDPPERVPLSTFDARTITAETIWEAAERAGRKCLVAGHPASWPSRLRHGYVVAPFDATTDRRTAAMTMRSGKVHTLRRPQLEGGANGSQVWETILHLPGRPDQAASGANAPGEASGAGVSALGEVRFVEDGINLPAAPANSSAARAARSVAVMDAPSQATPGLRFAVTVEHHPAPGLVTLRVLDGEGETSRLQPGDWSTWYFGSFATRDGMMRAACRLRLLALDAAAGELQLVQSQIYPVEGITSPPELADEIVHEVGPIFEHPAIKRLTTDAEKDSVLSEARYQALWYARMARYLHDRDRRRGAPAWDLYQMHWHWPDTVSHGFLGLYDPASPAYDPARAEFATDLFRRTYQIADEMVGAFLELADDDTYVFVVSDHGNAPDLWEASAMRRLEECGLVKGGSPDGKQAGALDWARSKAYLFGTLSFCVNLKGREVHGWVEPEDYERVQDEIIDALYTWKDPVTGKRPIALALKRQDAPLLGLWGETAGDVVFLYNSGFSGYAPASGSVGVARGGASHGAQPPTARTAHSSNLATLIGKGPGIRAGYERDRERLGLIRLVDVVPTICHLLGFPPPAHSQGAVLYDILEPR